MGHGLRWLAVIPSAFLGWYVALFFGVGLTRLLEGFCAPEFFVDNACTANWFRISEIALSHAFSGMAASLVVLFPVMMAPSHRFAIAIIAFVIGSLIAVKLAWDMQAWGEFLVAGIMGTIALLFARGCRFGEEMPVSFEQSDIK